MSYNPHGFGNFCPTGCVPPVAKLSATGLDGGLVGDDEALLLDAALRDDLGLRSAELVVTVDCGAMAHEALAMAHQAGVDVIVVDTAHGHSQGVLDTVAKVREMYPDVDVIAGNVATAAASSIAATRACSHPSRLATRERS